MKLETDTENNVAYLSLLDDHPYPAGVVDRTVTVHATSGGEVNLDFDKNGALLGIEFLDAKTQLAAMKNDLGHID